MCGIAGIIGRQPLASGAAAGVIESMTSCLSHRGPDGSATWVDGHAALGHTRLSIIDLSDAGRQPMLDETGRYVLVYNGEVYNYKELRAQLQDRGYRFRTQTDTEVVLHAWLEWGPAALDRFNGMWAFAIWDRERGELFAARDRAGKKPFYYVLDGRGAFFFASEVKALLRAGFRFGLDPQAAFDFVTQGTYGHLGDRGFFAGVSQLPAAHWLRLRAGAAPQIARYWDLPAVRRGERVPYDDAFRRRFRDLLADAVRLRLRADVPVGATLSGGLDSSAIVALVDQVTGGAPLHLFTRQYPGSPHDESAYFDAVVARLRRPVVHRVAAADHDGRATLLQVLYHQEEPFGDTSILAHFDLMRCARASRVPVVLSGQGGDELLMGYPSLVNAYLGSLLARGHLLRVVRESGRWVPGSGLARRDVMRAAAVHSIPLGVRDALRVQYVRRLAVRATPKLRQAVQLRRFADSRARSSLDSYVAQVFTRFAIPHLTHYDDRNAMAFGVEGRMPFLDHRLVELLFAADYEALFSGGLTKRVLRESCADLLPDVVRQRRDKVGFYTPLASWLRHHADWVGDVMTPERVATFGALDPGFYARRLSDLRRGGDAAALDVWRGFILQLWAERFEVSTLGGEPTAAALGLGAGQPTPARAGQSA